MVNIDMRDSRVPKYLHFLSSYLTFPFFILSCIMLTQLKCKEKVGNGGRTNRFIIIIIVSITLLLSPFASFSTYNSLEHPFIDTGPDNKNCFA